MVGNICGLYNWCRRVYGVLLSGQTDVFRIWYFFLFSLSVLPETVVVGLECLFSCHIKKSSNQFPRKQNFSGQSHAVENSRWIPALFSQWNKPFPLVSILPYFVSLWSLFYDLRPESRNPQLYFHSSTHFFSGPTVPATFTHHMQVLFHNAMNDFFVERRAEGSAMRPLQIIDHSGLHGRRFSRSKMLTDCIITFPIIYKFICTPWPRQSQLISTGGGGGVCGIKNKIYMENMNNHLQSMKVSRNVKLLKLVTSKGEC